ncbi:response regulator [Pontibacter silvestris]|uniref:Response regulator n=1 Tax=Pontibacter silvestris TaxID=2305183 RepID=A0ABW4X3M2_9BACT|nr:response regulator [Pontibacter silvestris]MCC9134888.1 response regulator [Pontibacter silvestris]
MKPIERVLVIDDDETSIFLIKRVLSSIGINNCTQTALNGLAGLNILKEAVEHECLPQLILLDIKMPVMDGFAFLEGLEGLQNLNLSDTIIILLSSSQSPWEKEKATKSCVTAFLSKPLTKEKLQSIID